MSPPRNRPPYGADERIQLVGRLDMQRAIIHWKCEGLSGADASNEIVAAHSLDEVGHPDFGVAAATLRWILLYMIEETARHAGHMDAIREILDGEMGDY